MTRPIRVLAWGNDGRSDDGAALQVLDRLEAELPRFGSTLSLQGYHQLGPEVAVDLSDASLVIFVDAHVDDNRPPLAWEPVQPEPVSSLDSHHCTPAELLSLCNAMQWPVPPCYLLAIRAYNCDYGDELSASTRALVEQGLQLVLGVLADPTTAALEITNRHVMSLAAGNEKSGLGFCCTPRG
jgi:hydrogenase maturation protease